MIILLLLLLVFSICVFKIISTYPPKGKHTWECGYCSYRGPVDEVIKHAHDNHQTEIDKEDSND